MINDKTNHHTHIDFAIRKTNINPSWFIAVWVFVKAT